MHAHFTIVLDWYTMEKGNAKNWEMGKTWKIAPIGNEKKRLKNAPPKKQKLARSSKISDWGQFSSFFGPIFFQDLALGGNFGLFHCALVRRIATLVSEPRSSWVLQVLGGSGIGSVGRTWLGR